MLSVRRHIIILVLWMPFTPYLSANDRSGVLIEGCECILRSVLSFLPDEELHGYVNCTLIPNPVSDYNRSIGLYNYILGSDVVQPIKLVDSYLDLGYEDVVLRKEKKWVTYPSVAHQ